MRGDQSRVTDDNSGHVINIIQEKSIFWALEEIVVLLQAYMNFVSLLRLASYVFVVIMKHLLLQQKILSILYTGVYMEEKLLNLYINILNYNEKVSLWEITH
jgi:hypothetical protein